MTFTSNNIADPVVENPEQKQNGKVFPRQNKTRRVRYSTSNVVAILIFTAVLGLLYTSTVINVNELLSEISLLNGDFKKINNENALLKSNIAQLSSYSRISLIAQEKIGMVHPKEAPQWFSVNE
ncbi:MAG: FtsL-like putative cell division protein [Bacteroidota bacterium]